LRLFNAQLETGHLEELTPNPIEHELSVYVFGSYAHVRPRGLEKRKTDASLGRRGARALECENRPDFEELEF
jgi:hypothetical protein